MTFSDETLMAYVDGELEAESAAAIQAAAGGDSLLAQRIERQRALRKAVHAAYEPVLEEPMPGRLLDIAGGARIAPIAGPRRWTWFEWTAVAASLGLGVVAGATLLREPASGDFVVQQTGLVASGKLATALAQQLASDQPADARIRIGLTFLSRDGKYCRTFTREKGGQAGLACNDAGTWKIEVVARASPETNEYRTAGAQLPDAVLRTLEERMQGSTLDATAERQARERGWRR